MELEDLPVKTTPNFERHMTGQTVVRASITWATSGSLVNRGEDMGVRKEKVWKMFLFCVFVVIQVI